MSFCKDVKNEICSVNFERSCCKHALLNSAFAFFNLVSYDRIRMTIESKEIALFLNELIIEITDERELTFKKNAKSKGYTLESYDCDKIHKLASKLGLINKKINQVSGIMDDNLSINPCCQRAAVIGAFLVAGSVTNPNRGYHFEISNHRKDNLHKINEILMGMDFYPKIITRGSDYVLYLKEKETIADMLNYLNCKETFFEYHDAMILKDKMNNLNRKINCEQANLDKTVNAAVEQLLAIEKLKKDKKFDALSQSLKEVANLRVDNPEASLTELSKMCKEPLSRSGINHRLKKIIELSREK
ncbi:MAG: DNA-binding protein WhiA [Clostridia bacterium]|nr:DNA-binding protein WhiA [Oscillospiraceae bacterium]MBR4893043.1 DNA-binding protein WhiA [Clostridia bacterium]